jgi:hypothetical protein
VGGAGRGYRGLAARLDASGRRLGLGDAAPPSADHGAATVQDRLDVESSLLRLETRVGGWQDEAPPCGGDRALEAAARQLELLRPLEAPVEDLRRLRHHHLTIGTLPAENVERVAAALFQVAFVLVPLERRGDRTPRRGRHRRARTPTCSTAPWSAFFEPVELPDRVHRVAPEAARRGGGGARRRARARPSSSAARETSADEVGAELAPTLERVRLDLELCEALRRFPCREGVYVIGGWVSERRAEAWRPSACCASPARSRW